MLDISQVFQNVSQVWVLMDIHGKVLLTSDYLERFQHLFPAPVRKGGSVFDSIPDSWLTFAQNTITSLVDTHSASLEVSYTTENEKETYFEIECTSILDSEGCASHIFVDARDVTRQKIFEKRITIVAREYQSMIENANAVIIGSDSKGYITEWNEMACQVLGYSKLESYLKRLSDFFISECQEKYSLLMENVLGGNVTTNCELIIRAKDGTRLTLLTNATPKRNASNQVVGILLIGQDITELSVYRQSLEQKVKERTVALKSALESEKRLVEVKDRFVSMASHEFRSPIGYIHRNIDMIKSQIGNLSPADIVARLSKIQSQAEHLTSLLEDVLTMGKTNATDTRIKANLKSVNLSDFLLRIIDEVQTNTQHSHKIQLEFLEPNVYLQSDENLLRNIFVNLLTNAVKFSPGKDRVDVCVRAVEEYLQVQIRDWGLGIEEKDLSKVFEPFHRGDNVQKIKGTGLGLPIVKKAVETLGGTIDVESRVGEGSQFTVKLNLNNS